MPGSKPPAAKRVRRDVELDETDHEILRVLAADARTPNNVLAAHVGLAASTCLMRVRRLQDTGVIRGFHADLAPEALGRPLQAIVSVRLQPNARPGIGSFARRFAAMSSWTRPITRSCVSWPPTPVRLTTCWPRTWDWPRPPA